MKDITRFINEELKPRLYYHIPEIFPELHFKNKGNKYVSNLHPDGTEGTGYKEDRSVITEKKPYAVFCSTSQEPTEIIKLFMQNNRIAEVWEAVNRLCSIVGIAPPEYTPEGKENYRQSEQRRTALEASAERQKEALFSPEGRAVLDYLHSRGWTDSEIREAELGYISVQEAKTINAQPGIGDFYTLSIPLRSGSILYGFKFRTIQTDTGGLGKYRYISGVEKSNKLFNLTGIRQENGSVVVVEGELDALHAQTRGVKGIVATGGGKLTEELLKVATSRGIKRITLLFDKDEKGAEFVRNSIDTAHKMGISVLVATFPDGESLSDGRPVHDIDEYLQLHTPEELKILIKNAISGTKYLFLDLLQPVIKEYGEENLPDAVKTDLLNRVIALANHTPNELEREEVFSYYVSIFNVGKEQTFSEAALRAVADRERDREDALRMDRATGKAIQEAQALYDGTGNIQGKRDVQAALQRMGEAYSEIKLIGDRQKYGDLLRTPSREERIKKFKEKPDALKTSYQFTYQFTDGDKTALQFTLPSGALTILAAPTSHGKSTFLRNLAIDIAKRYKEDEKSVLYFTFEESEEDVIAQFTNTYIGKRLHAVSKTHSQLDSIIEYFKTGQLQYIGGVNAEISREEFKKKEEDFSKNYLDNGKIRIYYRDYDLETLIEAMEFAVCNISTRAIFIDYIQILRSQRFARQPRAEQLKEICISLKDFSIKYKIPVILAAQLNRDATTPFRMNNNQMAESSDIEKAANTIICLWNSKFKPRLFGQNKIKEEEQNEINALENKKFVLGEEGKLFAVITKMRGSRGVGMYSIFDFYGYSGKVVENYKPEKEQGELPFEEEEKKTRTELKEKIPFNEKNNYADYKELPF